MNIKGSASLRKRFAFRLWVTSYVMQADILSSVGFLLGKIDDIELVLFKSEEVKMHKKQLPFLIRDRLSGREVR